jgi:hypothetical protein
MSRKTSEQDLGANFAALAFAAFAIVLLNAFLSHRALDEGQLGILAGNLGGGPWIGWEGFRDSLIGTVAALCILISWFGLGSLIGRFVFNQEGDKPASFLNIVIPTAVGAAIWSLIWFFVGLIGGYSNVVAIAATIVGLALAFFGFRRLGRGEYSERSADTILNKLLLVVVAVPLVLAFIAALAPPTAKDTLLYHLVLPKAFIAGGGLNFVDGNIASYLSLGAEMHNVWAMLLGGLVSARAAETAAGATTFLFFPLLLLAVYGWAREIALPLTWRIIAVLLMASIPTIYHISSSDYIDVALALFVTLAIYSLSRWWKSGERHALVLVAIFLGAALSIKLTAVFIFAAFALVILLRARSEGAAAGKVVVSGLAALMLAGVIASPWYLRTWKATGSPVFPFYMSIWKGEATGWDVERSNLFQAMNTQYGGENKTAVDYLLAPWKVSVAAQPEIAEKFDGVIGIAFLMGLPVLVLGLWKFDLPVDAKIGAGIAGIMFLFWLFSSQQIRYLVPVLPALAIAISAAGSLVSDNKEILKRTLQVSFAGAAVAGVLVSAAWFCQKAPVRVVLGGQTRGQYLTRNLDYYPYYAAINSDTPADAKVWLINMRRDTYNLERPVFSDYLFEDWTLRKMVWESRDVQDLRAKAAAMGVKYILARHDFLLDYDHSTIVDDKKPRGENETRVRMARDLVLDPANTIKVDSKFSLIKVL